MPKVYLLSEVDVGDLTGDERLYVVADPTGTPQDGYIELDTLASYIGARDEAYVTFDVTGTHAIDMSLPFQHIYMEGDTEFDVTNLAPAGVVRTTYVYLDGAQTPSWSPNISWGDAGEPTYSEAMLFVLTSFNDMDTVAAGSAGGGFLVLSAPPPP